VENDARGAFCIKTNVVFQKLLDAGVYLVGVAAIGVDGKFDLQILVHRFTRKDLGPGRELQRRGCKRDQEHAKRESR
jgi:hypothetical protein